MSLIKKKIKKCVFLFLLVFGHKKRTSQKNFFTVPNHTGQENFLKLPKKSFFSKIFIFTYFFSFFTMYLIRKNKKKVLFLVLTVFGYKKSTSQKNFLKLPNKNFFSKIFIFTCFFRFFPKFLIRKNKKKCSFFVFADV
jgi:hypothetical protein